MNAITRLLLSLITIISNIYCQSASNNSTIAASIENASSHKLDWVRVEWEGPNFSAGILSTGAFSTDVDLKWPFVAEAKLTFVDYKTRQRYNIKISLEAINKEIQSGRCRAVTIRILDHDKAEVVCGYPRISGRKAEPRRLNQ